ncbi:MAG TPA: transcription termination factor NusA [Chthonomonadaceae bacterium]|nr:transcription termination factor NusA [Chthonomonadaceae bacterium]
MNGEFIEALQQIAKEKDIPLETLIETVESALATAYKRNYPERAINGEIKVRIDSNKAATVPIKGYCEKVVVEEVENDQTEISLEEARQYNPDALVGEVITFDVPLDNFGRIAAQTAKQVVVQRIREAERRKIFDDFNERVGEVITGTVQRREGRNITINIGKLDAILPPQEQVETEPYRFNDRIKVYVLEVRDTAKGPQVIVSRTHPSLIRRLFELEVPEIADGIVTIKSVAREPGARSKIAVMSRDEKVDPVGACVGHRGSRVQAVVNELYDEKIDIVRWNADTATFIGEALSPAKAVKVTINEEAKSAFVVVPDNQLSLAIGKAGQNVRLAARLTGWRIDIRSEAQVARAALMAVTNSIGDAEAESAGEEAETLTIGGAELRQTAGEEAAEELVGAEETGANGHQPTEEGADEAAIAADRSHSQEEPTPDVLTAETEETGVK